MLRSMEYADAALGDFNGQQKVVVAIEGKGPKHPLDRPFAGRATSAVDQGSTWRSVWSNSMLS